jgi:hypothetical protein
MAYYIFLKSLRSLEEFTKNPHVKIPLKSPSTNFPSLGKFKIQFLFEKNSSSEFSPLGPAGLPTPPALACQLAQAIQPLPCPKRPAHSASQPPGPRMPLAYFTEDVFLFGSHLPEPAACPSFLCQSGPSCQLRPPPLAA